MKVVWSPQAIRDRENAYEFIERESPLGAVTVDRAIVEQVQLLADHPFVGRAGRVRDTRELVISGTHYIVVYRIDSEVLLLRVLHTAQRWPRSFSPE